MSSILTRSKHQLRESGEIFPDELPLKKKPEITQKELAKLCKEEINSMHQQLDIANQTIIALRAELNKEVAISNAFAYANIALEKRIKFLRAKK